MSKISDEVRDRVARHTETIRIADQLWAKRINEAKKPADKLSIAKSFEIYSDHRTDDFRGFVEQLPAPEVPALSNETRLRIEQAEEIRMGNEYIPALR